MTDAGRSLILIGAIIAIAAYNIGYVVGCLRGGKVATDAIRRRLDEHRTPEAHDGWA